MHSLWRTLALQWLGGDGSEALTGDSAVLEGLVLGSNERPVRTFDVRREPQVSRKLPRKRFCARSRSTAILVDTDQAGVPASPVSYPVRISGASGPAAKRDIE
jgi:hypothetical protein